MSGIGLRRVLIAGAGDLGRMVADRMFEHRELGYQVVGFVDDRAGGDHLGYRGVPLLGTLAEAPEIAAREQIDHLYVALPMEEHVKMLDLVEGASRECVDVKVVPDLLQFIALRARLEDLDGMPVINVNDMPLQGLNAFVKRALDIAISIVALAAMVVPGPAHRLADQAQLARAGLLSPGRGWASTAARSRVYKFRTMPIDAEDDTGPVWADDDDPRATAVGRWLRRFDLDEWPQFLNVLKGEMSIVGPRPERPYFVEQFKHRIPQYMLRHKVKAGITGWAQVNGWRGNTSLEKRIEYDLYYIENWSVSLDLKIIWLTAGARDLLAAPGLLTVARHAKVHMSETRRHHRRGRLHRLAPVRRAARPRLRRRRHRQPAHRRPGQHRAHQEPRLRVHQARRHQLHQRRRAGRLRAALGQPGQPDRLPGAADPDAEGRRARHAQGARPGQGQGRAFVIASTSEVYGDPLEHPQKETYWGNVNPIGPRGVYDEAKRFAEAMTMAYHRYHGARREDRPHLQHLRPAHARARRPRRAGVHVAGAAATRTSRSSATAARRAASATSATWSTGSSG